MTGPPIRELDFATRDAAFHWMVNFAHARRNLTEAESRYLLGRKYTAEKKLEGAPKGNQNASKKQRRKNDDVVSSRSDGLVRTADRVAQSNGVCDKTVWLSEQYADAVDKLDNLGVVPKTDILSGKLEPSATRISAAKDSRRQRR